MRAGNLLRQGQPHAAARRLGRIERHKKILRVGNAQALSSMATSTDEPARAQLTLTGCASRPSDASAAFANRLMNICSNWSGSACSCTAGPLPSRSQRAVRAGSRVPAAAPATALEPRRRQLGQQPVRLHKAVQRVGAALHHAQAAAEIAPRSFLAFQLSTRASRLPAMDLIGASELLSS